MAAFLIILSLIALPFAEIAVFIEVGRHLGIFPTLGLTILTAVVGVSLVTAQGFQNLRRLQAVMAAGDPPVAEMVHGLLLLMAGFFLFLPGFITDALGALLLIPPLRTLIGRAALRAMAKSMARRHGRVVIIDGEAHETDPQPAQAALTAKDGQGRGDGRTP